LCGLVSNEGKCTSRARRVAERGSGRKVGVIILSGVKRTPKPTTTESENGRGMKVTKEGSKSRRGRVEEKNERVITHGR